MKIAMLGAKAVPAIGGIAHYIEELGSRLVARGHDVTVYCRPHFLQGANEPHRGMQRVVTGGLRGKHLDAPSHMLTSARHCLTQDFDIIHIHGSAPAALAPYIRRRHRARIVVTIHGLDWEGSKWGPLASRVMYLGARLGARGAHQVTAVSQWVSNEYYRRLGVEAAYVPTGVDLPETMPAQELYQLGIEPQRYIFCAARLVREKGVHYLLDAFENLDTNMKLVIAGSCPYQDSYVQRLHEKASDKIIFAGYVTGRLLAELYSNAYLYVQPSEMEGLPIAVLEAMSYGRYVLASDIPQNKEALGPCGGTFRTRDVEDLTARLGQLLTQQDMIDRHCSQARNYMRKERSWDITADRFEELYANLCSTSQSVPVSC